MVIIVLLDGGGEACSDGDVRDFVFAVGAQLDEIFDRLAKAIREYADGLIK